MSESHWVEVTKDNLVFSAAHFITYDGDCCERLHGHNYRVAARVHGPLDSNHYVIDFIALRDGLQQIVGELDHRVLLPTQHPMILVEATHTEVVARYEERRWVFPREDCILLPVPNTTTELLARWIGKTLVERVDSRHWSDVHRITILVDENFGQWGAWENTLQQPE